MSRNNGFTLIEISVVLFIIGMFVFIAVPRLQDATDYKVKSASRRIITTVRYLYNEAAFKRKIFRLMFDLDEGEYWVEELRGNEFLVVNDPVMYRRKLPSGVFFKDVITERTYGSTLEERSEFILFLPTGFVEPAVIYLETEGGDIYTLETKPYTGGVRVYDEFVELLLIK